MNYSREFLTSLKRKMLEERKNYLDSCHTKEKEVFKASSYGARTEFFYLDGYKIEMPEYLQNIGKYRKYLFSM